jgi:opacity protein-like surface antigen
MKLKNIMLSGLVSAAALAGKAQVTDSTKWKDMHHFEHTGGIGIEVTYRKNNVNQLNSALSDAGLPDLSAKNVWFNLTFNHVYCNKVITEFGLGFTPTSKAEINDLKVKLNQGEVYYRIGYNLTTSRDFRLYPFAGANLSSNFLTIQDNPVINSTNDFTQELLNKSLSKNIRQTNFGLEFGAGFDYLVKRKPKNTGCYQVERVLPLGLKAGRYFQTGAGDWKIDSHTLSNAPDSKNSAYFVSLTVGLGYSVKK